MKTENLSTLKIHQMSKAQYNREEEAGNIDKHAIYITPDEEINLTPYATINYVDSKTYNNSVSIQDLKSQMNTALGNKSDKTHTHDGRYYTESEIDTKISNIQTQISNHARIHDSLVPNGTSIPENADLNTLTYLKVGNYYCSQNKVVQTLKNCPLTVYNSSGTGTNGSAFMMQVYSPISPNIDNETSGTWVYRIRKITHYNTGVEYIQYCYVGGTAGASNWVYGDWYVKPRSKFTFNKTGSSTAAIGSTTQPIYVNSNGDLTACKALASGAYVESNIVKKPSGADSDAATITWSNNNSNLWFAPHPSFSTSNKFYLGRVDGRTWDYIYASTGIYVGGTAVSLNGHTHDDRYYTESEINTKLSGKSDTGHTHHEQNSFTHTYHSGTGYVAEATAELSRFYPNSGLIVLQGCIKVTCSTNIAAYTKLKLCTISGAKGRTDIPVTFYDNGDYARMFTGYLERDDETIYIKCNAELPGNKYFFIYYNATYTANGYLV